MRHRSERPAATELVRPACRAVCETGWRLCGVRWASVYLRKSSRLVRCGSFIQRGRKMEIRQQTAAAAQNNNLRRRGNLSENPSPVVQRPANWPMAGNSPYNNGPPYAGNWKGRLPTSRTILRKVRTAGTCAGSCVTSPTAADCLDAITWHAWQEATMACAVLCFKRPSNTPCLVCVLCVYASSDHHDGSNFHMSSRYSVVRQPTQRSG